MSDATEQATLATLARTPDDPGGGGGSVGAAAGPAPGAGGAPPNIPTADLLVPAIAAVCALFCPAWALGPDEHKMLADAWAPVVDKWFPDLALGPEIAAVLVTCTVLGPKIGTPRRGEAGPAKKTGNGAIRQQFPPVGELRE
jgi:hypothetical protein